MNTSRPAVVARRTLIAAVAMLATIFAPLSSAQTVNATLVPSTIGNNGTFTLTLQITTNFVSSGITYFLQSSSNANGLFRIVSRDMSMSPYPDPTTDDATAFGGDAGLLNPVNDFDLGSTNNGSATDPPGMYTIAVLTLQLVNPFPGPGRYDIFIDRGIVTDRTGGGFEDRPFTAMASFIIPVPEPATVSFAVFGGLLILGAAWRSRR
jgi:hypothetical protein